jgi:hypothetical protein
MSQLDDDLKSVAATLLPGNLTILPPNCVIRSTVAPEMPFAACACWYTIRRLGAGA